MQENLSLNSNPEVNRLPEADALPDGFVESSTAETSGDVVTDYREEILVDADRLPELLTGGCRLPLTGNVGGPSESASVKDIRGAPGEVDDGDKGDGRVLLREVSALDISVGSSAGNSKKEALEVKRKSGKRNLKSEKEFLEFSLKYQQVVAERDSALAVRDRLESLCRELQRQNKLLMVSSEGQNLRLDLSSKFQNAIKEVSSKLEEQKDECMSQLKENEMLKIKLKQLVEQYNLSEKEHAQQLKQKTLELQLAELNLQQHEEKMKQEQSHMKLYADQVSQLLATEKSLRMQVTADSEKFQLFQEALVKSNEVFDTYKQEVEKMASSIKELKKENTSLKSKCEKTDITLIELADERERLKKQLEKTRNQKDKLESLCRSLQAERKTVSGSSKTE